MKAATETKPITCTVRYNMSTSPDYTRRWPNAGLMMGRRSRQWPNNGSTSRIGWACHPDKHETFTTMAQHQTKVGSTSHISWGSM